MHTCFCRFLAFRPFFGYIENTGCGAGRIGNDASSCSRFGVSARCGRTRPPVPWDCFRPGMGAPLLPGGTHREHPDPQKACSAFEPSRGSLWCPDPSVFVFHRSSGDFLPPFWGSIRGGGFVPPHFAASQPHSGLISCHPFWVAASSPVYRPRLLPDRAFGVSLRSDAGVALGAG